MEYVSVSWTSWSRIAGKYEPTLTPVEDMRAVSLGHKFDGDCEKTANGLHSPLERIRRGMIAIGDSIGFVVRNCLVYLNGICKFRIKLAVLPESFSAGT